MNQPVNQPMNPETDGRSNADTAPESPVSDENSSEAAPPRLPPGDPLRARIAAIVLQARRVVSPTDLGKITDHLVSLIQPPAIQPPADTATDTATDTSVPAPPQPPEPIPSYERAQIWRDLAEDILKHALHVDFNRALDNQLEPLWIESSAHARNQLAGVRAMLALADQLQHTRRPGAR